MQIKTPKAEHAEEISAMLRATFREINGKDYPKEKIDAWVRFDSPEEIHRRLDSPYLRCFLAVDKEEIIGFACICPSRGTLNSLYIKHTRVGQGVGSQLLEFAEMMLKSRGNKEIALKASHTAINFYKKRGYAESGKTKLLVSGEEIIVTNMKKQLTQSSSCA